MHRLVLPNPLRLALARSLAWALLFGGWLVLGEAGQRHLPLWAGGLVPLALWLAGMGLLLVCLRGRRVSMGLLRAALLAAGMLLAGLGLAVGTPALLLASALLWSMLLVAASLTVQALRRQAPSRPPAPLVPATAGALLAWSLVVVSDASAGPGPAVGAAALALALLVPRGAAPVPACRGSLFDCSLPWPDPARWRRVADWPQQAALLAMLPMMATLPAMAAWCRSDWGLSPATGVLWHLAAMLLPALLLLHGLARAPVPVRQVAVAALMGASGVVMWARPGLDGLMVVALLQAAAWSLAWAGPMLGPPAETARVARPVESGTAGRVLAPPLLVLTLGVFTADFGPDALRAVQALLATLALVGAAAGAFGWLAASLLPQKRT
jgi:hypothetical protein